MKNMISIVIPVYKSSNIVSKTIEQTMNELKQYDFSYEILLVNDGSPDNSWEVIKKLALEFKEVKAINLVKNYGQHNAVLCGFEHAKGDYVITMDDDLQNPPSEIIHLINAIKDSEFDLVFGKFKEKKHASYRKIGSRVIGYLNEKVFDKPKDITLTNFRIIKKEVVKRVLEHKTSYPYIPGLLLMYASNIGNVLVEHHDRTEGKSNYTFSKIFSLVSRLLLNYSSYPLRLLSTIGIVISFFSFLLGSIYLIKGFLFGTEVQGWTTLVVLTSFLGGFIIVLLGIIGEYLSRILEQVSTNRSYHIKEVVDE
jgi:glycosyltransferase involved in cell wall biosynthesis